MADKRSKPKRKDSGRPTLSPTDVQDFDSATPKFCLHHLDGNHSVKSLPQEQRAAFATALQDLAAMTWREIKLAPRHGKGSELIHASAIKPSVPEQFQDRDKFMALRYSGMLPMVGVRITDVFHVLWIEQDFGDVYDHG